MTSSGSASAGPTTLFLKFDLGAASGFEQHAFPRASLKRVEDGTVLLRSTMEEMARIEESGVNLANREHLLLDTNARLEVLKYKQAKLARKTLNPFKMLMNYRAAQIFHNAALNLYLHTKHVSDHIQKEAKEMEMQAVPSTEVQPVDDETPPDTVVSGVWIPLEGPVTKEVERTIKGAVAVIRSHATNPFVDNPQVPQLLDGEDAMSLLSRDEREPDIDRAAQAAAVVESQLQQEHANQASLLPTVHVENLILAENSNIIGLTSNRGSQGCGGMVQNTQQS